MKIRKFAAALLALVLCLSLSLPAAFAEAQQRVELKNLTVNVKCTGNAIPDEQLTIRLTPRKKAPMPGDAAALEAFVNTADCTRSNGYMTTATFPETFVFTAPGTYEYEVAQQKGGSLNGTYDTRTMVLRVTVSWSDDTLVAVAKVYEASPPMTRKTASCSTTRSTTPPRTTRTIRRISRVTPTPRTRSPRLWCLPRRPR